MIGPQKAIEERTKAELIGMFLVGPIVIGVAMLTWTVLYTAKHWPEFSLKEWLWQVGWPGVVGLVLTFGLPSAGCAELQKRRQRAGGPPRDLSPKSRRPE
jgi:hypothetical protein